MADITRRTWMAGFVLLLACTACTAEEKPLFTFMQFSDVHVGHGSNRPAHKRLLAAIKLANKLKPSFVIDSGDMTTHPVYKAIPEYLAELDEYRKYVAKLAMPIYPLPGNHDIGYFDYTGSKYSQDHEALVAAYKKKIGPLNQSFTHQGFRFILFNNNPPLSGQPGHISDETFGWIESELKKGEKAFLFCHVQILKDGTGPPWGDSAERLVALCEKYGVMAVAYGHQHAFHIKTRERTRYIMCPDLKNPGHREVLQYRIFRDRFELWLYDVFSQKVKRAGRYNAILSPVFSINTEAQAVSGAVICWGGTRRK
ncbi:MAG: metallophosphoesterase [Pirellulales bacterium]|nr:metallophosphoesterase [Pirellulales bacterium]